MTTGSLPDEGDLQLGSVWLPAGKYVTAGFDAAVPVAWVTRQAVPDAGLVWAALSAASRQTGLVPFLLGSLPGDASRPWDTGEFSCPADPAQLDQIDAVQVIQPGHPGHVGRRDALRRRR